MIILLNKPYILPLALLAALFTGIGAGLWVQTKNARAPTLATTLTKPRVIPPFAFSDQNQQPFSNAQLQNKVSVFFFGFTQCPDVCPATLAQLSAVEKALGAEAKDLQVILVSVDPERDQPEVLKPYVEHFNPNFTAIYADEPHLKNFASSMAMAYAKVPQGDSYTMDHSAALAISNRQGNIMAYVTPPYSTRQLADTLKYFISEE